MGVLAEYNAEEPLTTTMIAVVGLDDALGALRPGGVSERWGRYRGLVQRPSGNESQR